jgi:hypothetical protein
MILKSLSMMMKRKSNVRRLGLRWENFLWYVDHLPLWNKIAMTIHFIRLDWKLEVSRLVIFFFIKQGCWFYTNFLTLSSLILLHSKNKLFLIIYMLYPLILGKKKTLYDPIIICWLWKFLIGLWSCGFFHIGFSM